MEKVKKQYGLWMGIAMVIGIVIGSGVFLKAGGVLELSGGDLKLSLLAWLVGGVIMICSGFCFAVFASKITKYNGVVDYIGCSNFAAYQIAIAQAEAANRHFLGLTANQAKYNLMCRLPEVELIPASQALGLGFINQ